jgi:uncharacterized protein
VPDFLLDGPENASFALLLAHGAGAPMDAPAMVAAARALAGAGFRVARFEFGYMAARRGPDGRKPPPRAETLIPEYRAAVAALPAPGPLIIGGKSMGGRVASLVADELHADGRIRGLLVLSYPFHPPNKPDQLRTRHLGALRTPTLFALGTRDTFGSREEVASYTLAAAIRIHWLLDGDHDLKPRRRVTGLTAADHLTSMSREAAAWARAVVAA